MIAGVSGTLVKVSLTKVIVCNNGISYRIFIPMSTYDKMPREGKDVSLLTYFLVREDSLSLFGFATESEKKLFEMLLSVSGIGAKIALNILSSMPVSSFCSAILNDDIKSLSRINGIGKKSAERMVVELRDKAKKLSPELAFPQAVSDPVASATEDAILALEQLGFKYDRVQKTIHQLISSLPEGECTSENLIKKALQNLNS